jgi:tRNA-binding EMAP/Myf-like protein
MDTPELVSFGQWAALDIRVGRIVSASLPEWSNKLIELHVDLGSEIGERVIFTAMRQWKSPADFEGKQSLFLTNLPPKKMGESESQGMILALDPLSPPTEGGHGEPVVLLFDDIAPNGSRLL